MNGKRIRNILALTLTLIMSFTVVADAFAGTMTEPVQVVNDEKVINDDVDLENPSTVVAVEVVSRDVEVLDPESDDYPVQKAADASLTVNGNVSISKDDGSGYAETVGVSVSAIGEDSNARLVVNGDVIAHSATDAEYGHTSAHSIGAISIDGGKASVTVDGKAVAEADGGWLSEQKAISAGAIGDGSQTEIVVGKGVNGSLDLTAENKGTVDVTIANGGVTADKNAVDISNNGGTINGRIDGDVVNLSTTSSPAVSITNGDYSITEELKSTDVEQLGNVFRESEWYTYSVPDESGNEHVYKQHYYYDKDSKTNYIYYSKDGVFTSGEKTTSYSEAASTSLTVKGNVTTNNSWSAVEINSKYDGTSATLDIDGNISNMNSEWYNPRGLYLSASDDSEIKASVTGNVISTNANNANDAVAISANTTGGKINLVVDGDAVSTGAGVKANNTKGNIEIDIGGGVDVKGSNIKTFEKNAGIIVNSSAQDSTTRIGVNGDISVKTGEANYQNTGIKTVNKGGEIIVDVNGNTYVDGTGISVKTETASKIENYNSEDQVDSKIIQKAEILEYDDGSFARRYMDGNATYWLSYDEQGVFTSGYKETFIKNTGSTNTSVKGDLNVTADEGDGEGEEHTSGIYVSNNLEQQDINISVGGNAVVSGGKGGTGVTITGNGGKISLDVGGNVESNYCGINLKSESDNTYNYTLLEDEILAMNDLFTLEFEGNYEDEEGVKHHFASYRYSDGNGGNYSYYIRDGRIENASASITESKEAVNTVKVGGNVEVKDAERYAIGINVSQNGNNSNNSVMIGGDVTVEGTDGGYAGIETRSYGEGSIDIGVDGKVRVTSEKGSMTGVSALVYNGETDITINGGVTVEGKPLLADENEDNDFDEYVTGVMMYGWTGKGKINVTVLDNVSATALINSDHATAVSVYNGGVRNKNSSSLSEMDLSINGNVDSSGTGIFVDSGNTEREFLDGEAEVKETEYIMTQKTVNEDGEVEETRIYYNEDGKYYYNENGAMWKETTYEAGSSNVKVVGDVNGDDIGININSSDNASILVDGTVSGHNSSILVNNEIIDDNMTLTVWEILPDDEGNYAERVIGQDKDGNDITVSDEQLLQQIQYIIRIEPTQVNYINTLGTTDYEGYKVANEGDTVTLKLNIPAGYIVDGAYGDVDQQIQLLKDDNGDYYLIVPRGGGVLLSLKMHRAAARTVKLTFNPNGGTIGGSSAPYTVTTYLNKEVTLPTPDEREGYDFLGWFGADYGIDDERWSEPDENSSAIQKGGATFKAEGDMTFTAVWKKK